MALSGWSHATNYRLLTRATTSQEWSFLVWVYPTATPANLATPLQSREGLGLQGLLHSSTSWTCSYGNSSADYNRNTGLTAVVNAWQMLCGTVYTGYALNKVTYVMYKGYGGSVTSDTWETVISSIDAARTLTNWRQYDSAAGGRQFVGRIAVAAVWDTVLTAGDVDQLYLGRVSPLLVKRSNLRICNYMQESLNGAFAGDTYTDYGTLTKADGAPLVYPTSPKVFYFATAATEFTAAASLTSASSTLSASATFTPPTYTASASLTSQPSTLAAAATHSPPEYTAAASLTAAPSTLAASATFDAGTFTAAASLESASSTLAASASFVTPVYTAAASLTSQSSELAASAAFVAPAYTAAADLSSSASTLAAAATFTAPVYTAAATLSSSPSVLTATATFAAPVFAAAVALVGPSSILASAVVTSPHSIVREQQHILMLA